MDSIPTDIDSIKPEIDPIHTSPCIYIKHIFYPDQPLTLESSTCVITDYYGSQSQSQLRTFVPVPTSTPIPKNTFKRYLIPIQITLELVYENLYQYQSHLFCQKNDPALVSVYCIEYITIPILVPIHEKIMFDSPNLNTGPAVRKG